MVNIKALLNIFAYLSALISFFSVIVFLNPLVITLFFALIATSIYLEKENKLIDRKIINLLSVIIVLFSLSRVNLQDIILPSVETLVLLLGIKFIEEKKPRDYIQIYIISVFILAGRALLSLDITYIFFFLALFFTISIGLVILTFYSRDSSITLSVSQVKNLVFKVSFIPILAIPVTVLIFIILPRPSYPIFSFLNQSKTSKTGFSSKVEIGEVSDIQETQQVAFRFVSNKTIDEDTYIRGIVLDYFDGQRWIRKNNNLLKYLPRKKLLKNSIKQTVFLAPYGENFLFGINYPVYISKVNCKFYNDFVIKSSNPIKKVIKYEVFSINADKIREDNINTDLYLQVPKKISQKVIIFAKELKKGKTEEEFIKFLKDFFIKNYKYSLKKLPVSKNPIEDFLFKYKYGNCEYFASATALILRINKIPARLVAGYRGVYYNKVGKYYMVFQKDAHVWIEYYSEGYWKTLDTTPYYVNSLQSKGKIPLNLKVRILLDTINYYYIHFIVNFDTNRQILIAKNLNKSIVIVINFLKNKALAVFLVLLFIVFALLLIRYITTPLEKRALKRFLKTLEKRGYKKSNNEGLEEFVMKIDNEYLRELALKWVRIYESKVYQDKNLSFKDYKLLKNIENLLK